MGSITLLGGISAADEARVALLETTKDFEVQILTRQYEVGEAFRHTDGKNYRTAVISPAGQTPTTNPANFEEVGGGGGDVVGPASATDNALARFDLATGKLIQNSLAVLTDAGILSGTTKIGIGVTVPESALVVSANIDFTPTQSGVHIGQNGANRPAIELSGSTDAIIDFVQGNGTDFQGRIYYQHSINALSFFTAGTIRTTISTTGVYTIHNLTGPDTRIVAANPAGNLITVPLVSAGIYAGSGTVSLGTVATVQDTLTFDGGDRVAFTNHNVSIGIGVGDSKFHVHNASAGTVTANINSIATLENNTSGYLSILTPDATEKGVLFGEPSSNAAGGVIYNSAANPDGLEFRVNGNVAKFFLLSDGKINAPNDHQAFSAVINGSGAFQTVNFPTAFPAGSVVSVVGNMVQGNTDACVITQNITNSSFQFRARNIAGSHTVHTGAQTVNFIAMRIS